MVGNGGHNGGSMVEMVFSGGQCWERWLIVGVGGYSKVLKSGA